VKLAFELNEIERTLSVNSFKAITFLTAAMMADLSEDSEVSFMA